MGRSWLEPCLHPQTRRDTWRDCCGHECPCASLIQTRLRPRTAAGRTWVTGKTKTSGHGPDETVTPLKLQHLASPNLPEMYQIVDISKLWSLKSQEFILESYFELTYFSVTVTKKSMKLVIPSSNYLVCSSNMSIWFVSPTCKCWYRSKLWSTWHAGWLYLSSRHSNWSAQPSLLHNVHNIAVYISPQQEAPIKSQHALFQKESCSVLKSCVLCAWIRLTGPSQAQIDAIQQYVYSQYNQASHQLPSGVCSDCRGWLSSMSGLTLQSLPVQEVFKSNNLGTSHQQAFRISKFHVICVKERVIECGTQFLWYDFFPELFCSSLEVWLLYSHILHSTHP